MKNYSRLIQKYAVMLPPAPSMPVEMPDFPVSGTPDAEAIEAAQLKRVEEIEKAREESEEAERLKQEHIAEMLKMLNEGNLFNIEEKSASHSADTILKICTRYSHLCTR